ncbi:hypothetical protein QBC40DRAFT_266127 [Triangularia verruculosa]|uniref:Sacsin/Nov domain-containing protein n=1 Tax=Triangularia verruculosa TaxID=2587418 RepID=A0AAN6XEE8_9PEZI|nr:hypothetical protein QBC40DRAFT_266127 [Triangularia verruculosa]
MLRLFRPNTAPSKQQAFELVQSIADHHGHLDERTLATMDAATRLKVERALLAKDKLIGQSVITLARELYSKDVRFIFELLQNADDNHFTHAKSRSQDPYICFRVHSDRIIVECNEDGFTEANLRAICSIGQSSKHGAQGYIGEKGIGFKSVFKVAWKVHIQSGNFSFCFTHRPGDSGMGMISPEWYSPENMTSPPAGITRMTFTLHNGDDHQLQAAQRQNIVDEFESFRPAMLLFLKRLRRIEIYFFDDNGNKRHDTVMSLSWPSNVAHRATITTTKTYPGGRPETSIDFYHVTKLGASGLKKNENRTYSAQELASEAYSKADVVLAFPLTGQSSPILEPQDVFAFLPIRKIGFNFLIHTDFVTMANREDIVTSSQRNQGLRQFLVETFVLAVQQMCEHPQLRFQWMRYLPPLKDNHWGPFWSDFATMLQKKIAEADVIVPFKPRGHLRSLTDLKQWPTRIECLDSQNRPVFDDLPDSDAKYLSLDYEKSDLAILRTYGMHSLSLKHLVSRAEADLKNPTSKMKSPDTDAEWHSLAANILQKALNDSANETKKKIHALPLLPLSDGRWVSAKGRQIYFPTTTEDLAIPAVLELNLVAARAVVQPERKALFEALGVTSAASTFIRSLIMDFYSDNDPSTLDDSLAMLHFLYLTHHKTAPADEYGNVTVVSSNLKTTIPTFADIYFRDESDPYGPAALGLDVKFLHDDYMEDSPRTLEDLMSRDPDKGWRDWLHQHIGIRTRLRLAVGYEIGELDLSTEVRYVAEHQPAKLLGLLHHLWTYEGEKLATNKAICKLLGDLEVLCEGEISLPLQDTILPTTKLREISQLYLEPSHKFRFLELEPGLPHTIEAWSFLTKLGVIVDDEVQFFLQLLYAMSEEDIQDPTRVLRLYAAIQAKCETSSSVSDTRKNIQEFCNLKPFVYILAQGRHPASWVSAGKCVLNAPADMECRYPIDTLYDQAFSGDPSVSLSTVKNFLHETLKITSCSWQHHGLDLKHLKYEKVADGARIRTQYKRLQKSISSKPADIGQLRTVFTEEALVFMQPCYIGEPAWYKTTDCVWSTAAGLRGKANLRSTYPELKAFFVDLLGVDLLNINMIYDVLSRLDPNSAADYSEAKTQLLAFSNLLPTAPPELMKKIKPEKLQKKSFLPVTCAGVGNKLVSVAADFTIIDRQGPMAAFRSQVKTLDFDMEEIHDLEAFIEWAGLTNRYLSKMVRELPYLGDGPKVPVSNPLIDIRKKAHGILRVAKFFRSPRFKGDGSELYAQLRRARVWETDDISAQLVLEMNGQRHVVPLEKSDMYIAEEENDEGDTSLPPRLTIYIPHDETDQDVCIQHKLPHKLVEWMMTDPTTGKVKPINGSAVRLVTAVLNAKLASLPRILEQEGIHDVGVPDVAYETDDEDAGDNIEHVQEGVDGNEEEDAFEGDDVFDGVEVNASGYVQDEVAETFEGEDVFDSDDETLEQITRAISALSMGPHTPRSRVLSSASSTPFGRSTVFTPLADEPETPLSIPINLLGSNRIPRGNHVTPRTAYFEVSPSWGSRTRGPNNTPSSSPQQYRELLRHMIIAGQRIRFPDHGNADPSPLRNSLTHVKDFANPLWLFSTWERGAAGELFVFELLNTLAPELPGFCAEVNWTSKLRNLVSVHPDYSSLNAWEGASEISDLQYLDSTGAFTALLVEKGYHSLASPAPISAERPKKYHFEVKCTPQGCDEPFYMGGSQYNKMKAICEEEDSVYIIFRVFNLYTDRIDVRLFVNPAELERQGLLTFSAEKYIVKAAL